MLGRAGPRGKVTVRCHSAGFSLVELIVIMAVIGVLFSMMVPSFLSYYQASQLTTAAQQVRTLLGQARELAIKQNGNACVKLASATQMQYYLNTTCTGAAWLGAGTDGVGNINLPPGVTVTASANPVFGYLGAVLPVATYTITNATTGATLTVSVALSGRLTIP
jgi:Tfp pilus assembly protein FimT